MNGIVLRQRLRGFLIKGLAIAVIAPVSTVVLATPAVAVQATGDIVFVVDESGSMGPYQDAVKAKIGDVADQLAARGIDFRFGLVGYDNTQRIYSTLTSNLTSYRGALSNLKIWMNGFEDGFKAVKRSVQDDIGYRGPGTGTCVILVSDEDADVSTVSRAQALAALNQRNARFFGIIDPTWGTSDDDYGPNSGSLAEATGGQIFDIRQFVQDPSGVMTTLTDRCADAILEENGTVANAGPNQSVDEGAFVELDGRASTSAAGPLTYKWRMASHTGPDIVLTSATSATPVFQAADDGVYLFELTVSDGVHESVDEVVVTVGNRAPTVTVSASPAYAGGVSLITASYTDPGYLDTHTATVNWGDGTPVEAVPVIAGAGWGSLFASHRYAGMGAYSVTVTVTDDDGASSTSGTATQQVMEPIALWSANSIDLGRRPSGCKIGCAPGENDPDTDSALSVYGRTHANTALWVSGGAKDFHGATEYVTTITLNGGLKTFDPPAVKVPSAPFPFTYPIADYRPGGPAALAAGANYHDMSSSCSNGTWQVTGTGLASGIYYVNCAAKLNGSGLGGTVTLVAEGNIEVSGTAAKFDPYTDGLLFRSGGGVTISASNSTFFGYTNAAGSALVSGSGNTIYCGILANFIGITANQLAIRAKDCAKPTRTEATPLLVPTLQAQLTNDNAAVLPGQPIATTATLSNGGATLLVPGILGAENLGGGTATVSANILALEYLDKQSSTWQPVPGQVTVDYRINPTTGVSYGTSVVGTTFAVGSLASWGFQAKAVLTPSQVNLLLDPARTGGVRVRSDLQTTPSAAVVRRLFRFGGDVSASLRTQTADLTSALATIAPPSGGDPAVFNSGTTPGLAILHPGDSVPVTITTATQTIAPRAAGETNAGYLNRLRSFDGTTLTATGYARATSSLGMVIAPQVSAVSTRAVPIVTVDKSGPESVEAGQTAAYTMALSNSGSAAATLTLRDDLANVGQLPVSGTPATLAAGASASASASYAVAADSTVRELANSASLTWTDARGTGYGPMTDSVVSLVIAKRNLVVRLTDDHYVNAQGQEIIRYQGSLTNLGDQTVGAVVFDATPDPYTRLRTGSVTTSQGTVAKGNTSGDGLVRVSVGTIAGRDSIAIGYEVEVVRPLAPGVSSVSMRASVDTAELGVVESDDPDHTGALDATVTALTVDGVPPNGGTATGGQPLPAPTVAAPSVADGAVLTKPTAISAQLTAPAGETVSSWRISYRRDGSSTSVPLASGATTTASATFDPTTLPNGAYAVTISATASGGGITDVVLNLVVDGELKLGRFTTGFVDHSVAIGGLPLRVQRSYDSFDLASGDFGTGWRLGLANFRVATNGALGHGGWTETPGSCFIFCVLHYGTTAPHYVTITWPDGHQELFDLRPADGSTFFRGLTSARFVARAGSTSTLEVDGASGITYSGGSLYDGFLGYGGVFDPHRFKLTAADGTIYILDRTGGLIESTDTSGNKITVTSAGVTSSLGEGIAYARDPGGRITTITSSAGTTTYDYTAGRLTASHDTDGLILAYGYDAAGRLTSITGPGSQPLQTVAYGPDGRVATVTDADGNTITLGINVGTRQETLTDPTGRKTAVYSYSERGDLVRQDDIADGSTRTTTYTYDEFGHRLSRTDPSGVTISGTYDAAGNLTSWSDGTGISTTATYGPAGNPLTATDSRGHAVTLGYDSQYRLTTITDAAGQIQRYGYDGTGNVTSATDVAGQVTTYTYDAKGRVISRRDPLGNTTGYGYDTAGRMTSVTDPLSKTTSYTYDAAGRRTSTTDALGKVTSFGYDSLGRLTSITDPLNRVRRFEYSPAGVLVAKSDGLNRTTRYTADANGQLLTSTNPAGEVTSYAYNGFGDLATVTDPLGRITRSGYDAGGRLATTTMPNSAVWTYGYDTAGRHTRVTDPLGFAEITAYDADGRVGSRTDRAGKTTTFAYDQLGRATATTDPLGHVTRTEYGANGQVSKQFDAAGAATIFGYDIAGRLTRVTDPTNRATVTGYDAVGQVTTVTDPAGHVVTTAYDAVGRVTSTTSAAGVVATYAYDAAGQLTSTIDGLGHTSTAGYDAAGQRILDRDALSRDTSYAYDLAGRLRTLTDPAGGTAVFGYDAAGQQTAITDAGGHVTTIGYSPLGAQASVSSPATGTVSYAYDPAGRRTKRTGADGRVTDYSYDPRGLLTGVTAPSGTVTYAYDDAGRRTGMTDPTGTTTFGYNLAGRVTSVQAPAGTVGYGYDAAGRRTSLVMPGARTVSYGYDPVGALATVTTWDSKLTSYTRDADERVTAVTRPNGVVTGYTYDAAGRLATVGHTKSGTTLAHFDYALDAIGRRTGVTSNAGTESYEYDTTGRIAKATYPDGTVDSYTYDQAGNRTSITKSGTTTSYTYDAAGRLTQVGSIPIGYDANGAVTSYGSDAYSYNEEGQLTSATVAGVTTGYTYDGDGVRTKVGATGQLYDRTAGLPQLLSDGTTDVVYGTAPIAEYAAGTSYPLTDGLGSARVQTNASGTVTGSVDYAAFGTTRAGGGSGSGVFGYAGERTDPSGLIDLRARSYRPDWGRFTSSDSLLSGGPGTQGFNRYAYSLNDPVNATDPSGHSVIEQGILIEAEAIVAAEAGRILLGKAIERILILVAIGLMAPPLGHDPTPCVLLGCGSDPGTDQGPDPTPDPEPEPEPDPLPLPPITNSGQQCMLMGPATLPKLQAATTAISMGRKAWQAVSTLEVCSVQTGVLKDYAGGQPDLNVAQGAMAMSLGIIPSVSQSPLHAERVAIERAKSDARDYNDPVTPIALFSNINFCGPSKVDCDTWLQNEGAFVFNTGRQGNKYAFWYPYSRIWS